MCGRIVRTSPREAIAAEFGVTRFVDVDLGPRFNVAPSQAVEAIVRADGELRLGRMRWGFAHDAGADRAPINARAETVAHLPLFRDAFARRRCLVIADGFYEWRKDGKAKRPYFVRLRSCRPFALAGIWASCRGDAESVPTCAILTCAPNELMTTIHNRMPVILPPGAREQWIEPGAEPGSLRPFLKPFAAEEMEAYEVSTYVNSPRHDSPECVRRLD